MVEIKEWKIRMMTVGGISEACCFSSNERANDENDDDGNDDDENDGDDDDDDDDDGVQGLLCPTQLEGRPMCWVDFLLRFRFEVSSNSEFLKTVILGLGFPSFLLTPAFENER